MLIQDLDDDDDDEADDEIPGTPPAKRVSFKGYLYSEFPKISNTLFHTLLA